jgi:aminopeptidase
VSPAPSAAAAAAVDATPVSSDAQRTYVSLAAKSTVHATAKPRPARRKPSGRTRSPVSARQPTTTSRAPARSGRRSGSPSAVSAIANATSGPVPITIAVRAAPASRTASVKRSCDVPGASRPATPKSASARQSSSPCGSRSAPARTTARATAAVATAPSSASGTRRSATRSETVIPPKRTAEQRARATASIARTYTRPVTDPRVDAYARLLVRRSVGAQPGWQVLVATTVEALPLAAALSRELAAVGAYALPRLAPGGLFPLDVPWIGAAPPELAASLAPLEQHVVDSVDASIFVLAPSDPPADEAFAGDARRALRAQLTEYRARGRTGEIPSVRCDFPCAFYARRAGMELDAFADLLYGACLRDWDEERRRMEPVLERFDRAGEVRIVGSGTDLTLSLAGRSGDIDDGHLNVPGGEVYYCPVEDSAEGEVAFDVPSGDVRGIRLVVRGGEVVEAAAERGEERLHEALATDGGARRIGELGLGCNDGITRSLNNVLFDEKMAGTVHLALGAGIPAIGGLNRSDLHWDLVKDLRGGGELRCDGEVVQRDGRWLL